MDIGFLAMAIMPRAVCGVPQRMTIQAILLGPWQQRKILERNCFQNSYRDHYGRVAFLRDFQQLRNSARRKESKHDLMERYPRRRPSDDFINRPFDSVFASSLGHLRAVVLRL